jgi:sugar/nucleoside kinase (ribokinase family)
MIVKIGTDSFGNQMKENFLEQGISEEHIIITSAAASGVAPIAVESSGFVISLPSASMCSNCYRF